MTLIAVASTHLLCHLLKSALKYSAEPAARDSAINPTLGNPATVGKIKSPSKCAKSASKRQRLRYKSGSKNWNNCWKKPVNLFRHNADVEARDQ